MSLLDLQAAPPEHDFRASAQPKETPGERFVRLFEDVVLFLVAIVCVALIVSLCYRTLTSPDAQPEEKKWAISVLSAAAGGIIGYLIRK